MNINKFKLSRNISEEVKRVVRQRCGFGCIFCGLWIYTYEHIEPDFKDAKQHTPANICLLCPTHHDKVTKGRISKQQVIQQYKHPRAKQKGYANDFLELSKKFGVAIGRIFFPKPSTMLMIDNVTLLKVFLGEDGHMKLTGSFYDDQGKVILAIKENEFLGYTKNWDIQQGGKRTIIRRKRGEIVLQLSILPPNIIEIEKINMIYGSAKIDTNTHGKIFIQSRNGATLDLNQSQIVTGGPIVITDMGIQLQNGSMILVNQTGKLNKLDYQKLMNDGTFASSVTH